MDIHDIDWGSPIADNSISSAVHKCHAMFAQTTVRQIRVVPKRV